MLLPFPYADTLWQEAIHLVQYAPPFTRVESYIDYLFVMLTCSDKDIHLLPCYHLLLKAFVAY